jgi:hypothetical protein
MHANRGRDGPLRDTPASSANQFANTRKIPLADLKNFPYDRRHSMTSQRTFVRFP